MKTRRYTKPRPPRATLTPREAEVLRTMAQAADTSDKALAGLMKISRKTVETHLTNIRKKLQVRTRTACLVRWLSSAVLVGLLLCGCATTTPPPSAPPQRSLVEMHRAGLLRAGWTVHEHNGAEHWCSPGLKFKPRTPKLPNLKLPRMVSVQATVAGDGETVENPAAIPSSMGPSLDITAGFDTYILVGRELNQPGLGWWLFEPQVHSPNVVVDPGTGGPGYAPQLFLQYWR